LIVNMDTLDPGVAVRTRLTARAACVAGALFIAVALLACFPETPLNLYDVSFALLWGRELIDGSVPNVHLWGASTPHPASILVGALAAAFGTGALTAMRAIVYLAAGCGVVALIALGRAMRLNALGVVAALTLGASAPIVVATLGQATASDLPAAAAVLAAIALEAASPRRGRGPLLLLAFAGLFRPEAWVLSAAYWCYLAPTASPSGRVRFALLAASAPLLWMATDLVLTGNPLYSLTYTQHATIASKRPTGLAEAPAALLGAFTDNLGTPVLVGAACGALINVRTRQLPVVLAPALLLSAACFIGLGAATLPLNERYALPLLCFTAIFFAYFVVGWWRLGSSPYKWAWGIAAMAIAASALAPVPASFGKIRLARDNLADQTTAERQLARLVAPAPIRSLLRTCSPLVADWRIVPILAFDLHRDPASLTVLDTGIPDSGVVIEATRGIAGDFFQDITHPVASFERRHFRVVTANKDFTMYARC
jgi:hypothetical protein